MIRRPNVHPRTLPFDSIARTTYNIFNNNIFRQMATNSEEPTESPSPTSPSIDPHHQDTIGNPLTDKATSVFRVVGQNINGISPFNNFNKWNEILQSTVRDDIDCLCLSETNIEWRHPSFSSKIPTITKKFFQHSRLITSISSIKFKRIYKPGGTASLITNEWTGCILHCKADTSGLGRWTTTMMTRKRHQKIAVISAYQVCQTSISQCGITTCYSQQWHRISRS